MAWETDDTSELKCEGCGGVEMRRDARLTSQFTPATLLFIG
jgi:hypothetical protein